MNGRYYDADYEVISMVNNKHKQARDHAGELPSCKVRFIPESDYQKVIQMQQTRQTLERVVPFVGALLMALACFCAGVAL